MALKFFKDGVPRYEAPSCAFQRSGNPNYVELTSVGTIKLQWKSRPLCALRESCKIILNGNSMVQSTTAKSSRDRGSSVCRWDSDRFILTATPRGGLHQSGHTNGSQTRRGAYALVCTCIHLQRSTRIPRSERRNTMDYVPGRTDHGTNAPCLLRTISVRDTKDAVSLRWLAATAIMGSKADTAKTLIKSA